MKAIKQTVLYRVSATAQSREAGERFYSWMLKAMKQRLDGDLYISWLLPVGAAHDTACLSPSRWAHEGMK